MWQFERLTTSRVARCSAMRTRVLRERRLRACFLSILVLLRSFYVESSGSARDSTVTYPAKSRFSLLDVALLLLRFLDHNALVEIAHALALVRLGRAIRAD